MKHEKFYLKFLTAATLFFLLIPVLAFAGVEKIKTTTPGLNSPEKIRSNGEYVIEVLKDDKWQEAGSLSFDQQLRERAIDLDEFITANELVNIRLIEKGGGAAHIDSVLLGGKPPHELKGSEDSLALKKVSKKDFDVIDAYKKPIEVSYTSTGDNKLTLTARIEAEIISKLPFQFPLKNSIAKIDENSAFYKYVLNSNTGSIKIDGNINDENLSEPFFKEFSRTGSGHPSDYTYGWIRNDDKNLYVALDFVPDNTMDGDKDYAKVYVKTPAGVREFKVSVPEQKWGMPGFTYTEHAGYQHKVYEFNIPFGELGIENSADGEKMELAFAAYGTAASAVDFGDAPDTYGTLVASNGASHGPVQDGYWYLGYCNDSEPDGQPTASADGDDSNLGGVVIAGICAVSGDDEDGVIFTTPLVPGMTAGVDVLVGMSIPNDSCYMTAYLDFNRDGDFLDAGEQIISQVLAPGVNSLTFPVPASASAGTSYSRFRCASPATGELPPIGPTPNGEVEDHMVTISSPVCITPPSDMIAWWTGDNHVFDMAGSNNGTLMNGATYIAGLVGESFSFDGTDDFIDFGTDNVFNYNSGTGDFTIDMWIYPDILPDFAYGLASKATHGPGGQFTGPYTGWSFYMYDDGSLGFGGAGVWEFTSAAGTVTAGIGQHVAVTKSGSTYTLYHNGTEVASADHVANLETSSSELLVGTSYADENYFDGSIDEVEIFNRALSIEEIASIYYAGSAGKCKLEWADFSITKTDDPDPVITGDNITYTITITNNGPDDATEVITTDTLPAGVTFVSAVSTQGTCIEGAGEVSCDIGDMDNGASVTVTIIVTAPDIPGSITNTAEVSSSTTDPDETNNTVTEDTTVNSDVPLPDLAGEWYEPLTEKCKEKKEGLVCKVNGKLIIRNIGEADAEYVVVRFYLSDDDSYDEEDILLKADFKGKIVVGKDYKKSFKLTLPVGMSLEGRYIIVFIDAEEAVTESDENNNYVVYGGAGG